MLHQRKNKKRTGGFTMVELMVVLAIMGILAALVGGGLIAYTRLARFEKNEANARTLFQAAQISLTRMDTAGELDAFCADVEDQGKAGTHFTDDVVITDAAGNEVRRRTASELNNGIYALYYDKTSCALPRTAWPTQPTSPTAATTTAAMTAWWVTTRLRTASTWWNCSRRS